MPHHARAEDVVPRLMAAPIQSGQGAGAMRASPAAGSSSAESSVPAQPVTLSRPDRDLPQPGWMPRLGSIVNVSSILARLGLQSDGEAELEKLVDGPAGAVVDYSGPQSPTDSIRSATQLQPSIDPAAAAWRQGTEYASSAARQLQAVLLGFRPFPARAHFGSNTYLQPVPTNAHPSEDDGRVAPPQRYRLTWSSVRFALYDTSLKAKLHSDDCRRALQLLAMHRMSAYRERFLSKIQVSAPQLLQAPTGSVTVGPQIQLSADIGPSASVTSATMRTPLLPPARRDGVVSLSQAASSFGTSNTVGSGSETRWQLPQPFRTMMGRPQGMPVAIDVKGTCLDTVTSATLESSSGKAWPAHVVERPELPALLSVDVAGSKNNQRQSWAQWISGVVTSRLRSQLHDMQAGRHTDAQQGLRASAAVPSAEARALLEGLIELRVRLRSDWAEVSVELTPQPRCVWIISEAPEDASAFMGQLQSMQSASGSPEAASRDASMLQGPADDPAQQAEQPSASQPAHDQPAVAWRMRLHRPLGVLLHLQQRAAWLAAARPSPPAPPAPSAYGAGVQYVAIVQHQSASFEARLRSFNAALQQKTSNRSAGQRSSLWRKLQSSTASSAPQPLAAPDGLLIMLQSTGTGQIGAAPSAASFWHSASQPSQLEQLMTTTSSMTLPTLLVLVGSNPWSPSTGADLTKWARGGASVLHVASLSGNAQEAAAGTFVIQHAMYRLLTEVSSSPMRSKL